MLFSVLICKKILDFGNRKTKISVRFAKVLKKFFGKCFLLNALQKSYFERIKKPSANAVKHIL